MKPWHKQFLVLFTLLSLLLCVGCAQETPVETTAPMEETVPSTAPADPLDILSDAQEAISQAQVLELNILVAQGRTIDGVQYKTVSSGKASYLGLGTENMEVLISEDLTFGSYQATYTQSYLDGNAYCLTQDARFVTPMSQEEFLRHQIPALLTDSSLYTDISYTGDAAAGYTYQLNQGTGWELWTQLPEGAVFGASQGQIQVDSEGILRENSYTLSYTIGEIPCTLEVTVTLSQPDTTTLPHPEYGENCTVLEVYTAPRMLLQTIGSVHTFRDISCVQTETIYCEAAALVRTQELKLDTFGSGKDYMAQADYTVSLTDYTNTASTSTQLEVFRDGKYQYSINGADLVTQDNISQSQMETYCTDSILALVLSLENLSGASLVDAGDFYCLQMTCVESAGDAIFASIAKLLNLDLDIMAESATTAPGTAYITFHKNSGLPATMGYCFSRTHVIDGVAYRTTYQADQTLSLPSKTAYAAITGEAPAPEEAPSETATPLFYKITDSKGRALWLLGTIHVGDARTGFLPQTIYDAFSASDSLAVEFDTEAFQQQVLTDPSLQQQMSKAYYYADGSTTSSHIGSELYRRAYALILASGNNSLNATKMKPTIWESMLQNFYLEYGGTLSADRGVDSRLLALARQQEKAIIDIESGISQVQMLSGFSDALQEMLLAETVSTSIQDYCLSVSQLYEAWCRGDAAELTALVLEDTSAMTAEELKLYNEYNKAMLTDRNSAMLKAAKTHIRSGKTVFFAVGVAHLLGDNGLVAQLQKAGYKVEQITYT